MQMLVLGLLAFAAAAIHAAPGQPATTPTFVTDIAPLLHSRCTPCHQADGDAPFPLETFAEVSRHARQIAEVTAKRYMPPWKPDTDSPPFIGDRRLTSAEIALIDRWVAAGAPEGRVGEAVAAPRFRGGWPWGEPDVVLALP